MKKILKSGAAVLAALALSVSLAGLQLRADAVNADNARAAAVSYATYPLKANSVGASQLSARSVGWEELASYPRDQIRALQGPIDGWSRIAPESIPESKLTDSARKQLLYTAQLSEPKVIANVGGPINTQGTKLGLGLKLSHGTYLVTVSGQINRITAAASPGKQTQPQLSLWLDRNRDGAFTWKTEGAISPNATIPDTADRSATVSGQTVITVSQSTPLDVDLVAHGYNNDQSGAGSGELAVVNAVISAIPIAP